MEYGLRIGTLADAHQCPADLCREAGLKPDSDAVFTSLYFGTEFCQELLPGLNDTLNFCGHCADHNVEAVLLTPMVTYKGLERVSRLINGIVKRDFSPAVVFNDWGVFELLKNAHPALPLRMGRLMNRGLRDPRLEMSPQTTESDNTARGDGLRQYADNAGIAALESDADLEPGFLGDGSDGLNRTLHIPFTFVTSGRVCLEKAASASHNKRQFTRGLASGCSAPCRGIYRREHRQDTEKHMWRAGNTLFFKAPPAWITRHVALADRVVLHTRPVP